jgi:hypothetical protein
MRNHPSTRLAGALVLLAACSMTAQARRDARLRAELDATSIHQPLPAVWPAVLRLLADHGHQLVGHDRRVVGAPSVGAFKRVTAGGFETGRLDHGLALETMSNASAVRYRAEGKDLDGKSCRVTFTAIRRTGNSPSEERSRDLELEVELLRRLEPDQAQRIVQAADAVE